MEVDVGRPAATFEYELASKDMILAPPDERAKGMCVIVRSKRQQPAAHGRELPQGDLLTARRALDVAVDRVVETKLALLRQHQDGGDREGLAGAADAHGEIGCSAGGSPYRARRTPARTARGRPARCRRWRRAPMRAAWRQGSPCPRRRRADPRDSTHCIPPGVRPRMRP